MASEVNNVGAPHDKANAEYTLQQFKAWGWDAHIEVFDVLYPTPKKELLEITGATPFRATLTEKPVAGDETSSKTAGQLPAFPPSRGKGSEWISPRGSPCRAARLSGFMFAHEV